MCPHPSLAHYTIKRKLISQQPQNLVQPKLTLKVPVPASSQIHDKCIPVPDYTIL